MTATSAGSAPEQPLVSVVVPTFNRVQFLREALVSAVTQTYRSIEIIVSDDGSQENVLEQVISPLADPRIVYRRNPTTLGMGLNIWTAFRAARGKYVATLHDDDAWEPDFLASLIPPLEADDSLVVAFSDHHVVDERGAHDVPLAERNTRFWRRDVLPPGRIANLIDVALVGRSVPSAMASVFRRSGIDWDDFPPEVGTYYDVWLTYLAARTGAAGYYDRRRLTRYRVHAASETRSWTQPSGRLRALRQSEFMYRRYLQDPALRSIRTFAEREYRSSVVALTLVLFELGQPAEAREMLARAEETGRSPVFAALGAATRLPSGLLRRSTHLLGRARARVARARRRG